MENTNTVGAPVQATTATPLALPSVAFDLASIDVVKDAAAGAVVTLFHPTKFHDLDIKVTVIGRDSEEFQALSQAQERRRMLKAQKGGFRVGAVSADDVRTDAVELLARCTKGWTGMMLNGTEVPFSEDNAVAIYTRFPWIKEQIDQAVGDRALFSKA